MTANHLDADIDTLLLAHPPMSVPAPAFWAAQFDAGLAWVQFPPGRGGRALDPRWQAHVDERLAAAGAPSNDGLNIIGLGMAAPTLVAWASDDQLDRYLQPLFACEEIWCQLFSEPSAGSDLAGLATDAVRDGDAWVVNGQKVWTSMAHVARFGLLLARTDPGAPKHRGLTYFVVDMEAPGVEVRPLRQITGEAEFNEVFLTDVRIPDSERLGDVGDGWRVALTTLMNERVALGSSVGERGSGPVAVTLALWQQRRYEQAHLRRAVIDLWIQAEVQRLTSLRALGALQQGTPGPEGSIGKLAGAALAKRVYELGLDLLGAEGMLYPDYGLRRPSAHFDTTDVRKGFLRMRAMSIEGGTSEVMRNILAERVLGLPGDVRVDKDVAWRDVPRN